MATLYSAEIFNIYVVKGYIFETGECTENELFPQENNITPWFCCVSLDVD